MTRAQVLVALRNESSTPLEFVPSGSSYRILDVRGREVASGVFTYAVPDRVAPGGNAYLVETVSALFVTPHDVGEVKVVASTRPTNEAVPLLPVSDVTWRTVADGGLEASGVVTNSTQADIDAGFVSVLFFDSKNDLIGAVYDLTDIQHLGRGESARFSTAYPGTPPTAFQRVARTEAIAFPLGR